MQNTSIPPDGWSTVNPGMLRLTIGFQAIRLPAATVTFNRTVMLGL